MRIPTYDRSQTIDTDRGGMPRPRFDQTLANSIEGLGNSVSRFGLRMQEIEHQKQEFKAETGFDKLQYQLQADYDERKAAIPEDGTGLHDTFMQQDYDQKINQFLSGLPEGLREKLADRASANREKWSLISATDQRQQLHTYYKNTLAEANNGLLTGIDRNPENYDRLLDRGMELIETSGLDPIEKAAAKKAWKDNAQLALGNALAARDPETAKRMMGAPVDVPEMAASDKGLWLRNRLMRDFGLTKAAAAAFAGNLHIESGGFTQLQEINPTVKGSRGGYGWAQWTGPRRKQYEAWAKERGLDPATDEANYGFLAHELMNTREGAVLQKLRGVTDPKQAALIVSREFLRPGIPHEDKRVAQAMRYFDGAGAPATVELGEVDPRFEGMDYNTRLKVLALADSTIKTRRTEEEAAQKVAYAQVRDSYDLAITQNQTSEAAILSDPVLDDGDKASLIRKWRTANEDQVLGQTALTRFNNGGTFDPFDSDDRKGVGLAYDAATAGSSIYDEDGKALAVAAQMYARSGIVPKRAMNEIRGGLVSGQPDRVASAGAIASRLMGENPDALRSNENGEELAKAATTYRHMTETLGMSPEEAGQRMVDLADPEKRKQREAILQSEPVKKAIKEIDDGDVAAIFDQGVFDLAPEVGATEAAKSVMVSDYKAMLEESIVEAAGDMDLAKEYAAQRFQKIYGPSSVSLSGDDVITYLPPEKTYPAGPDGTHAYIASQLKEALNRDIDVTTLYGAVTDVYLQANEQTKADFFAGKPPRYSVYYVKDGKLMQYPGSFTPDPKATDLGPDMEENMRAFERNRQQEIDRQAIIDSGGRGPNPFDEMRQAGEEATRLEEMEVRAPEGSGGGGF